QAPVGAPPGGCADGDRGRARYCYVPSEHTAFIHEHPADAIANEDGDSDNERVQVLTNAGGLDRDKQIAVVARFTELIAGAPGNPPAPERIWVLLTEANDGGWGLWGHAHTNAELVAAARREMAQTVQSASGGKE
ncbi:MAG: hypothetical protein QOE94_3242, partial [Mycobacterium sp.]|nr:hypothetical protein [Mycobacterium sp.]